MVLQALEGLSDRDAIRQLRTRIDWKVACGLALDDPGFDFTVLTYWRTRLRQSERPQRIFDAIRAVVKATGVLKTKHRRALDSSILDDAVATQGHRHPAHLGDEKGPSLSEPSSPRSP